MQIYNTQLPQSRPHQYPYSPSGTYSICLKKICTLFHHPENVSANEERSVIITLITCRQEHDRWHKTIYCTSVTPLSCSQNL